MKPKLLQFLPLSFVLLASATAQETPPATPPAAPGQAPAANVATELSAAAEKLSAATSYAWSQTSSFGGNFGDRTTSGKKGAGGYILVTMPGRDQEFQVLSRKGKAAMQRDGAWVVPNPDAEEQGAGRWVARMVQNLREPTTDAKELATKAKDLKLENGSYKGTLDEATAKELMSFRGFGRRGGGGGQGGGGNPPEVSGAGGSVTFTVTNGVLSGYELTLTGRMNFNGEDRDVNRTTKVSFTGVGSTSFDIPEAAAGLLAE
ncbi:hypothetical protein [Haloferula sp. BvORR071]|uniref:hypothetical protein n=1 Tax=Haloferula sp. BvORR071 TaxID=1396141 RepID=UPI00054CF83C|nr:hypothetical protein [Haloferula sp. BvORR071]